MNKMKDIFLCPKCNTEWERNGHYNAILQVQNAINAMMGNKQIIDMCGKCNYMKIKREMEK